MRENDYGAGNVMLVLVVCSVAVGILTILLQARMARLGTHGRAARGCMAGTASMLAVPAGGFVGFFVVEFFPWLLVAPAVLFVGWAFGVWRRQGVKATDRGVLLAVLAFLWLGLALYGDRMKLWETTVSGPIRVDLLFTAAMSAAWALLGVWLRQEVDEQEEAEEEEEEEQAAPDGPLTAGIRKR